jgi:hypothetical protein
MESDGSMRNCQILIKESSDSPWKVDNKEFTGQHFPVYDINSDGFIEVHEAPQGETAY